MCKDERFNRTVKAEVIGTRRFVDLPDVQHHADPWRDVYNLQRPHEALDMNTPASRYAPSPHAFLEQLPPIEYGPGDVVRRVSGDGYFHYKTVRYKVSQAFTGQPIALRQMTNIDGQLDVFFCHQRIATIDLPQGKLDVTARSQGPLRGALIDLKGLYLVPKK